MAGLKRFRPKLFRTSSFRLTLLYAGLFGVSVMSLFGVIYWSTVGYMSRQIDQSVEGELAELSEGGTGPKSTAALRGLVAEDVTLARPSLHYLLTDADGHVLAGDLPAQPPVSGIIDLPAPIGGKHGRNSHGLRGKGVRTGDGGYLLIAHENYQLDEMQELVARAFFWSLAVTVVLALAGGMVMSAGLLRHIEAVSRTGREIVDGNLSRRLPLRGTDDEFDHLAGSFNTMLDRIEGLMEGLRQVSSDIAHDLRTPLTRLRQRLELARRRAATMEELQAALDGSLRDVDAILETFGALLRIAQIEAGTRRAGFTELDLTELLHTVVEVYLPLAEDRGQHFHGDIEAGLIVVGDRELLTRMLANVAENAIRHAPDGAAISVTGRRCDGGVEAVVADTGPGIPEALRDKVFQRFYRLDSSRTTPGNGLGLSLVAAVATLHGIVIDLDDNRPGLRVTLRFLCGPEPAAAA